jgi:SAM-dependent methyltransferase
LTWYRQWFGEDYLELYSYRDDEEAKAQIAFFKKECGNVHGTVLDLACGSGRHLDELREQGYDAVGCDLSYVLLRTGRRDRGDLRVARADMRALPWADSTFGALVSFFTSFGYFEAEDENAATVREMRRVIVKSAPVLFDYLNVHRELSRLVQREQRRVDGEEVMIERWFDSSSRTFNKRISIGARTYLERVRGYDLDELATLFASSGLAIRQVFGDFDGSAFTPESPRLIILATKRR